MQQSHLKINLILKCYCGYFYSNLGGFIIIIFKVHAKFSHNVATQLPIISMGTMCHSIKKGKAKTILSGLVTQRAQEIFLKLTFYLLFFACSATATAAAVALAGPMVVGVRERHREEGERGKPFVPGLEGALSRILTVSSRNRELAVFILKYWLLHLPFLPTLVTLHCMKQQPPSSII